MIKKLRKEMHTLTLETLRRETAEKKAVELVGNAAIRIRELEGCWVAETEKESAGLRPDRRTPIPARVYDTLQIPPVFVISILHGNHFVLCCWPTKLSCKRWFEVHIDHH